MPIQNPQTFDLKDLYLDVRLEAIVEGQAYDFTGRRYFNIGFFKEGIGFGITDIRIEVNTSLQPIVEITMMDLYGNTMFGGQFNDQGADNSAFFRWPPPKFMLTFKGYLGRPVTWMLNLKNYDINFISSSGHYEIKASFIPNQWGFFGDIPFLYLVAAKRLRMKKGQSQDDVTSIFDLIDIGRKVEVKNTEVTQKYNALINQMNAMYKDISKSIVDNTIYLDKEINGKVDGREVKEFKKIFVKDMTSKGSSSGVISKDDIQNFRKQSSGQTLINQFLFTKVKVDGTQSRNYNKTIDEFKTLTPSQRGEDMAKCSEVIRSNIDAINKEALAETYDVVGTLIGKITIGELFRQIAKDTAYIMGRILEAGFKGNSGDRASKRLEDSNSVRPNIVGKYYPLTNSRERDGEETPATERHSGSDYGVNDQGCEMDFVREFIEAVVDGIANDIASEDAQSAIGDDTLVSRISNLEAVVNTNPYRPFFSSIAENVIARSGIAAFMIRSDDPNTPGGYSSGVFDSISNAKGDSAANMKKLAESDMRNITDSIMRSLDQDNIGQLSNFATFFDNLISDDGDDFLDAEGKNAGFLEDRLSDVDEPVSSDILDYKVVMKIPEGNSTQDFNTQAKIAANQGLAGLETESLRNIINGAGFSPLRDTVNMATLMSRKLVNNSLPYTYPLGGLPAYYVLVLQGDDLDKFRSRTSAPTDSEFNSSEIDKDESQAKGLIEVTEYSNADGEVFGRVDNLNFYTESGYALNYSSLKSSPPTFRMPGTYGDNEGDDIQGTNYLPNDLRSMLWQKEVTNTDVGDSLTLINPGDIGYVALYAQDESRTRLVFGPFLKGQKGRNQRIYIKTMCAEILKKIKNREQKAQEVVSRLLGKANEQEDTIYKQFHSLFHQWSSMAYNDNISKDGILNGSNLPLNGEGIADTLENLYGGNDSHVAIGDMNAVQVSNLSDTTFIYDYPLQRIKEMNGDTFVPINVKNSIVNMDSMNKPDSNTTVLNMLYNICSKNNFMFLPIPGYAGYLDVQDVYKPYIGQAETRVRNYFHIMFLPTPESRPLLSNKTFSSTINFQDSETQRNIKGEAIGLSFGATDNQVVKNVSVGTKDNKVTAESIINLQRLVDNEDQNRTVTRDCSMLNVMAGRSYTAKVDVLGNAQIYPMQFFFLERMPLFDGLYQIMKVEHSIRPNDMTTTFEGIRMRFNPGSGYFSIPPVTLETMQQLSNDRPQPPVVGGLDYGEANPNEGVGIERSVGDPIGLVELRTLYQNGRIPDSALSSSNWLKRLDISKVALLATEVAESFERMMSDFDRAQFQWKQKTVVTSSYRSYQKQVELSGPNAATPGTSKHGWGVAVDFWWGLKVRNNKDPEFLRTAFSHPNYRWFFENGHKYGWYNPATLRDGRGLEEWWHWEYHGLLGQPEPLLAKYDSGFGNESIAYIRGKGGCSFIA